MRDETADELGRTFVFGAGGHAKVILEILEAQGRRIGGVFDQNVSVGSVWDYAVTEFPGAFDKDVDRLIIAVGQNRTRQLLVETLAVTSYGTAIHPSALISPRATIGPGTVVMAGVKVNADSEIGAHCIVNTGAQIDHDCVIGDFAHVSPGTTLCGTVHLGEGAHFGAGAVAIPGMRVGSWAIVGAGAAVVRHVPDGVTVVGTPARILQSPS